MRPSGVRGQVHQVERGDAEHRAGAFGIGRRDERRVHVEETVLLEEAVDGHGQRVADAEHGLKGVAARAQMRDVAQKLHGVALFLERIGGGVGGAVDFDRLGLELDGLSGGGRFHELAGDAQRGAGGDVGELVFGNAPGFDDHLEVLRGGAVLELDEMDAFTVAAGLHPAERVEPRAGLFR